MFDSTASILEFLDRVLPEGVHDFADQYGEPGYGGLYNEPRLIVLATYWCRCDKFGDEKLHDIGQHYPHAFERLKELGVEFEWYDEWLVTHDGHSKAWRTSADSYSWQPSYVITEDGEVITVDDDLDEWIAWASNNSRHAIPSRVATGDDLEAVGFEKFNGTFENGWYDGQNDDPSEILIRIDDQYGPDVEVVFALDSVGQFDVHFCAYYRSTEED